MYEDGAAYYELATGQATSAPISCLAFDQHEEAAWFGCSNGWISQSTVPGLERVCASRAHASQVLELRSLGASCLSLSNKEMLAHVTGGAIQQSIRSSDGTFSCMELYRNGTQILIGCGQKGLVAYDLISGKSTGQWETEGMGAVALRGPLSGGGYLAASPAGKIFVMDGRSRSVRPGTSLTAHVGGFAAVDAAGSLVATAGYSIRGGHPVLERAVKVFDIRMAPRLLCTLPFGAGPVFLRFHPHLPSTLLAGSASGAVSLLDAAGYGAGTHLSLPGLEQGAGGITCADFSPSGQCIGLGSASGWVHMLGVGSMPSVAGRGAEVPAPPAGNPAPLVSLGEGDPLSRAPLFYNLEGPRPLSSLHPGERASVGLAPRVVDPSLQPLIKWSDFVGVIPNPFYDPAAPPGTAAAASARLRAERAQPACVPVDVAARRAERAQRRAAEGGVVLPDRYRRVLVATQQAAAAQSWFQDYDYSACNASPFVGLENDLANSYCNALVQALFFVPGVRAALLRHVPRSNDEFCLAGELALLFRMLQTRGAVVCRASNLLRALRQSPQALALGLVEGVAGERGAGDIEVEATKERSLARRVQALSRFLLEALHRELGGGAPTGPRAGAGAAPRPEATPGRGPGPGPAPASPVQAVFGMRVASQLACLDPPGRPSQSRESLSFQLDLTAGAGRSDLAAAVQASLSVTADMRAWFDPEVQYTAVRQRRTVTVPPRVLIISCGDVAKERLAWWKGLQDLPGGPLPSVLAFSCDGQPEGVLLVRQGADLDAMAAPDSMLYELTGVVAHVCDADESLEWGTDLYEGHLVAHIKVPWKQGTGGGQGGAPAAPGPPPPDAAGLSTPHPPAPPAPPAPSDWWLFNDFSIQPVPAAEAGELYDGQKVPCLLFYTRRAVDAEERAARMHEEEGLLGTRPTPVLSSLGFQALCRISPLGLRANLRAPTFLPLGPDELPRPGMLLALDAEFVSYSPPQYSLVRGMEVTTRPSRLGLARVSVVRGEGALEGTACIDDYIRSPEAVHDYLTRFSGIVPGDLDPARSPHCLTTLRRAYLKLRYLVDSGVRFVGHGLKQDFRMINILVPSEQIVDTVRLFHKPRMRQLSLRFLASYLLKTSIQSGNHDSIEDAHTALRLYKEYLRLEASGALAWTLDELYNWGKAFGWEPVVWKGGKPHPQGPAPMPVPP
uniref:USP domain-containing protein n=1 Tax=Auxenochlorella protothecoides TaxID=3075 RepID=A0A1D1ZYT3_AUXPR